MEEAKLMIRLLKEQMKNFLKVEPIDLPASLFTKELQIMVLDVEASQPYCRQNADNFGKVINVLNTLAFHHLERTRHNELAIFGCSSYTVELIYSNYQHGQLLSSDVANKHLQEAFNKLKHTMVTYFQKYNDYHKHQRTEETRFKPTLVSRGLAGAMSYMKRRQRKPNSEIQTRILFVSGSSVSLGNLLAQRHVFKKAQSTNLAIDVCAIQRDTVHELVKEVDLSEGYYIAMTLLEMLGMFPVNTAHIELMDTLDIFKLAVRYRPLILKYEFHPDHVDFDSETDSD